MLHSFQEKTGGRRDTSSAKQPAGALLLKGRGSMTYFQRLVEAGIDPECAIGTCYKFRSQGDESGLKDYVEGIERRMNKAYRRCVDCGCI